MSDLTKEEQAHVRQALLVLRVRCGGWAPLGKILRMTKGAVMHIAHGRGVTASLAFRVARLVKVGVDELLVGTFAPPGTCPYCGRGPK